MILSAAGSVFYFFGFGSFLTITTPTIFTIIGSNQNQSNEYKVSFLHNENPIDSSKFNYKSLTYGVFLYDDSSSCPYKISRVVENTNALQYILTSNSKIDGKTLKDYENEKDYAIAFFVLAQHSSEDSTNSFRAEMSATDDTDASEAYQELPKLSQDVSFYFDVPILNESKFQRSTNGNNVTIKAELADDWSKNPKIFCRLERNYDAATDSNLQDCSAGLKSECRRAATACGSNEKVLYRAAATKDGRKIECILSSTDITKGKNYDVIFLAFDEINQNLSAIYIMNSTLTVTT